MIKKGFKNIMLLAGLCLLCFSACVSNKNTTYFQDVPQDMPAGGVDVALNNFTEPKIRANDILQVSIQTIDPQSTSMMGISSTATFNTQSSNSLSGGAQSVPGYLVDQNGVIELPLVGKVNVLGKTTAEAKEAIRSKAALYYKDPVVNVRLANFEITVLGEVMRPARYVVPNERVSVLDAIGMAGDLTIYGKRDNILLVREEGGQKKMVRFNLNSSSIFSSPYFYLKQGDVLYVEPNKNKVATSDATKLRTYTLIGAGMSFLIVVISRINFN